MQVCLIVARIESVSRPKFGVCVQIEDRGQEHEHPCINIKLYFVHKENIQQCEAVECERLKQHLIYWRKTLVTNVFGYLSLLIFVERSERNT